MKELILYIEQHKIYLNAADMERRIIYNHLGLLSNKGSKMVKISKLILLTSLLLIVFIFSNRKISASDSLVQVKAEFGKGLSLNALGIMNDVLSPFVQVGRGFFINLTGPDIWYRASYIPKSNKKVSDLVFNESAEEQVEDYLHQLLFAASVDDPLPPLLLYGASGTGKTELAKRLANEGEDYGVDLKVVEIHTQDLKKTNEVRYAFSREEKKRNKLEHLLKFSDQYFFSDKLKKWLSSIASNQVAKKIEHTFGYNFSKKKKLILFIDEGERLLSPDLMSVGERTDEIESFLSSMGSGSSHFTVVLTTNNPGQIDEAVLKRFSYQIHINMPEDDQRYRLIKKYIVSQINSNDVFKGIGIERDFLEDVSQQDQFYEASENISGRELQQIAYACVNYASRQKKKHKKDEFLITTKMILKKIEEHKSKKSEQASLKEEEEAKRLEAYEDEIKFNALRRIKEQNIQQNIKKELEDKIKGEDKK